MSRLHRHSRRIVVAFISLTLIVTILGMPVTFRALVADAINAPFTTLQLASVFGEKVSVADTPEEQGRATASIAGIGEL